MKRAFSFSAILFIFSTGCFGFSADSVRVVNKGTVILASSSYGEGIGYELGYCGGSAESDYLTRLSVAYTIHEDEGVLGLVYDKYYELPYGTRIKAFLVGGASLHVGTDSRAGLGVPLGVGAGYYPKNKQGFGMQLQYTFRPYFSVEDGKLVTGDEGRLTGSVTWWY